MTFYDSCGKPISYSDDEECIYLFTGQPVAYFYDDTIYGFNGRHFGWFENGWIRDLHGYCAFYTEDASGSGPAKPARYAKPAKSAKNVKPAKCARNAKNARAAKCLTWSVLSGVQFFQQ